MGLIQHPPYKQRSKITGLMEWIRPEPEEYKKPVVGKKLKRIENAKVSALSNNKP